MRLTEEDKKYILNEFLRSISHISDKEYQKRVWIRGEGPEVDDFDETICSFFDDGDPILERYKEYGITESQYQLLIKFRNVFEKFIDGPRPYLPQDFIDTLEWARIMEMANEVLVAFDCKKSAPQTVVTKDDKTYIVHEFLQGISHVTNREPPKRDWALAEKQETPAFADSLSDFFDLGDQILERYQEFGISDSQYKLLKQFCDEFKAFSKEHDVPEEFIDTPEWAKIMEMAKEVLKAFQKDS